MDDVDDIFAEVHNVEAATVQEGFADGERDGLMQGLEEGRELGLQKGYEIGCELGFYQGCVCAWRSLQTTLQAPQASHQQAPYEGNVSSMGDDKSLRQQEEGKEEEEEEEEEDAMGAGCLTGKARLQSQTTCLPFPQSYSAAAGPEKQLPTLTESMESQRTPQSEEDVGDPGSGEQGAGSTEEAGRSVPGMSHGPEVELISERAVEHDGICSSKDRVNEEVGSQGRPKGDAGGEDGGGMSGSLPGKTPGTDKGGSGVKGGREGDWGVSQVGGTHAVAQLSTKRMDRALGQLEELLNGLSTRLDPENEGLQDHLERIRGRFKTVVALLGLTQEYQAHSAMGSYPAGASNSGTEGRNGGVLNSMSEVQDTPHAGARSVISSLPVGADLSF